MDKLQFIVQSLSEEEKKGFEHFVNRFRVREQRKDYDLFTRLAEAEKLSQTEAFELLYGGKQEKEAYHALRKRLLGHLIDFISLKEVSKKNAGSNYNSEGLIHLALFLFKKGAYEPGWQYLNRAYQSEQKKDNAILLSRIYMIWLQNWDYYTGNEDFNSIYKAYVVAKEEAEKEERLKLAMSIVKRKIEQYKRLLKSVDMDGIIKEVTEGMDLKKKDFHSVENLLGITRIIRSSSLVSKDFENIESYLKTRLKKLTKKEGDAILSEAYWELVYFYAHALYRVKKFDESLSVLSQIDLDKGDVSKAKYDELYCKIELLKWACVFYMGNLADSEMQLKRIALDDIFQKNIIYDLDRSLNYITTKFAQKQFTKGLAAINAINHSVQWLQKKKGLEWRVRFQLIEMLLLYEAGKVDLVLNRIRSLKRVIKDVVKLNPNYKNLNVFLAFVNSAITEGGFKGMAKSMDNFEVTPFRQENIQAMAFYAYIKSKVEGVGYYETLIELVNKTEEQLLEA